jgi:hypothetical protein
LEEERKDREGEGWGIRNIVIYCISVVDSILSTQEYLNASANARAFNILGWMECD